MQNLDEQAKKQWAELATLFGAHVCIKLCANLTIDDHLHDNLVIQHGKGTQKRPMHPQLPAPGD